MNHRIHAVIVDDEPRGLRTIEKLLQLNCPQVQVMASCLNADDAQKAILQLKPEIVFLDIAMPGKNGIELLEDFHEIPFEFIFITAHNDYLVQAFRLSAVDYLLKPVEDDLLIEAVARAEKRIDDKLRNRQLETLLFNINNSGSPYKMKLCIPSLQGIQVVNISNIIYCEAKSNYTNIHFENSPMICSSKPIHNYEALLENNGFVRVHKSYLVNLLHIREYRRGEGGSLILSDLTEVEVSRRKKDFLMNKMREYFKG